jgi:heme-degrading monooxygenase HmoA
MIARVWSAQTTPARSPAYLDHLRAQVLPAIKALDGYGGAMLLERATPLGAMEIIVITFWRSLDSIRGFAGPDLEKAVVADEAAALLAQFDQRVRHYEVALSENV